MYISKKDFFKYFVILTLSFVALLVMATNGKAELQIALMWLICIFTVCSFRLDISHPYCWFSIGFTLYSTAYGIIYCMGGASYGYSPEVIFLPTIALVVAIIFIGPTRIEKNNFKPDEDFSEKVMRIVLAVLFLVILICVVHFAGSGFSSKSDMKQANDMFYRVGVYLVRYYTMFALIYLGNRMALDKVFGVKNAIIYGIAPLLFSAFTGERDAIIRYVAVMFIILFYFKRIKKRSLLILVPVFMLGMILTVYLKYYFLSGTVNVSGASSSLLYQFLTTDFHAAGRNLQYLLNNEWTKGSQGFGLLITELLYPFIPSGVFFSPDNWFNNVVHTGGFKGYAFTLVGTGYIIGGALGVIVVFAIVGIVIRVLYKKSQNNIYSLCVYIYMLTTIIFSFRGSLNTIFVALIRICAVSVVSCKILSKIRIGREE